MSIEEIMPAFARLSYWERWRVLLDLRRGRRPRNRDDAQAAIEYARSVDSEKLARHRIFYLVVLAVVLAGATYFLARGSVASGVLQLVIVVGLATNLLLLPMYWPGRMARCVAQSRALLEDNPR